MFRIAYTVALFLQYVLGVHWIALHKIKHLIYCLIRLPKDWIFTPIWIMFGKKYSSYYFCVDYTCLIVFFIWLYNHMFLIVCILHIVLFWVLFLLPRCKLFSLTVLYLIVACRHKWPILYRTRQKQTHETNLHSILLTETKRLPGGGYRHFQASVTPQKKKQRATIVRFAL